MRPTGERLGVGRLIGEACATIWRHRWACIGYVLVTSASGVPLLSGANAGDAEMAVLAYILLVALLPVMVIPAWLKARAAGPVTLALIGPVLRAAPKVIITFAIKVACLLVLAFVTVIYAQALGVMSLASRGAQTSVTVVVLSVIFVLILLSIAYLAAALSLSGVAANLEGRWVSGIGRSFDLTKGYRYPVLGLLILFAALALALILSVSALSPAVIDNGSMSQRTGALDGLGILAIYNGLSCAGTVLLTVLFERLLYLKEGPGRVELAKVFA